MNKDTESYLIIFDALLAEIDNKELSFPEQAELQSRLRILNHIWPEDEHLEDFVDRAIEIISEYPPANARLNELHRAITERELGGDYSYSSLAGIMSSPILPGSNYVCPTAGCGYSRRLRMRGELPLHCRHHPEVQLVKE